ncbi:Fimbrillin-A associated anchor proteins Mfa1 and Mfa2, partial [Popillia japonica]
YNMLSTDALSDQADLLMLYIFDERGILTATQSSGGMPLGSDYHMTLNDLPAGNYHFVAWARSNRSNTEDGGFDVPNPAIGSLSLRDMNYYLKRSGGIQQRELENLLVGVTEVKVDGGRHTQNVMVSLKKVNKKFRIVLLPYTNETTLDINDYDISITDQTGNGCIRYDYSLLPDEAITYRPYYADNV